MKLQIVSQNGNTILLVQDQKIDVQNAGELRDQLLDLTAKGQTQMVLDLQKVKFIDSSGLGALVSVLREARRLKGNIRVTGLSDHVQAMFTITRLNKIFEIL